MRSLTHRRGALALWARIVAVAVVIAAGASCRYPRTQVLVRLGTDMPQGPGGLLTSVHIEVFWPSDGTTAIRSADVVLGTAEGTVQLPADVLNLYPSDNSRAERFRVETTPYSGSTRLFQRVDIANFDVGFTRRLPIYLADRCRTTTCTPDETCGEHGCQPRVVPSLPALDASTDPDAAPPGDAAMDAAIDAATESGTVDVIDVRPDIQAVDVGPCDGTGVCTPGATRSCACSGTERCTSACAWGACTPGCPTGQTCVSGSCCTPSCPGRCSYDTCTGAICDSCPGASRLMSPSNCTAIGSITTVCNNPGNPTHNQCDCPVPLTPCCGGGCC